MKKKTVAMGAMLALTASIFSGCAKAQVGVKVESNGTATVVENTKIQKDVADQVLKTAATNPQTAMYAIGATVKLASMPVQNEGGVDYYVSTETKTGTYADAEKIMKDYGFSGVSVGADHAYIAIYEDEQTASQATMSNLANYESQLKMYTGLTAQQTQQLMEATTMDVTIEFPQNVTFANAETKDGTKAGWNFTTKKVESLGSGLHVYYAETMPVSGVETDTELPTAGLMKNNGVYNSKVFELSDNTGIAMAMLDNKVLTSSKLDLSTVGGEGKHTLTLMDYAKNQNVITFTYDVTKPTVQGVKNGKKYSKAVKIKCKDKYGIKSILLNGKKVKSGKKVAKKGSYKLVVTDKAGNQTRVKFKIK